MEPIVKWAGGKRRLLSYILPLVPRDYETYCEPFVGGGAVWLSLLPSRAHISDANEELILTYKVIRDHLDELIISLRAFKNESAFYYLIRDWDRSPSYRKSHTDVEIATRFLYLNRTCYNGLYRVNSNGQFNVPFGNYTNPDIIQEDKLKRLSAYLNDSDIILDHGDFYNALASLKSGDFVYLDPPYDPISETANYTGYTIGGFGKDEQVRLKQCCDMLDHKGVRFILSNSYTSMIRGLYSDYICERVDVRRSIGALANTRKNVGELLIRNYII